MSSISSALALHTELVRVGRAIGIPYPLAAARFLWLAGVRKFSPAEIFRLALLDPAIGWKELRLYKPKELTWPIFESGNRHPDIQLLNHKDLFYKRCSEAGLSHIECLETISREGLASFKSMGREMLRVRLSSFIETLPREFVAKPSIGFGGVGVNFFRKSSGLVTDWDGQPIQDLDFLRRLEDSIDGQVIPGDADLSSNLVIFQAFVRAHPDLAAVTGSDSVQSIRIVTLMEDDGPHILFAFLRLSAEGNLFDNYQAGASGNLIACIEERSGKIYRVFGYDDSRKVTRLLESHPNSGRRLVGFEVPNWADACELAIQAAMHFPNTRAVGWDIGVSDQGAVLIEGNGTWNSSVPLYRWNGRQLRTSRIAS